MGSGRSGNTQRKALIWFPELEMSRFAECSILVKRRQSSAGYMETARGPTGHQQIGVPACVQHHDLLDCVCVTVSWLSDVLQHCICSQTDPSLCQFSAIHWILPSPLRTVRFESECEFQQDWSSRL
ncbi:hypothetical protein Q8A67_021848 [Cirrhinus molitorella]|uniref:Uncharacterized protein n=1 Tax=Cirrhinus molitorella TaxID=172907 RepID=A0AA88P498_9TELE|nr:hypothetical protein Q8A67_021848 [Cirrhinus molitorella]